MKKIILILNGKSADNQQLRAVIYKLRKDGYQIDVQVTWESGDAARIASQYSNDSDVVLVAGGGDGTVNEVVNGMFLLKTPQASMAVLPLGTANDFATSAGIVAHDYYTALTLAADGQSTEIDVAAVNGKFFLNVASGGFGAEVTAETNPNIKKAIGGTAYTLTALLLAMKARPYHGRLITKERVYEGKMIMIAVGNGRQAGGGACMTPHAIIDDGLLDVMLVPSHDDASFANLLLDLTKIKLSHTENYHYLRLSDFSIECEEEVQFNLDGEPLRDKHFVFSVRPKSLRFVLPRGSPLLNN